MADGASSSLASPARPPTARHHDPGLLFDIVEEHFDEAAFYFRLWDQALDAFDYTLDEVRRGPEEFLRANIDGLVVGGEAAAERLLWPAVEGDEADNWTGPGAATLALVSRPDDDPLDRIMLRLPSSEQSPLHGIARALGLAQRSDLDERLRNILYASDEDKHAVLLDILAERGVDPGPLVGVCLQGTNMAAARSALRAVRHSSDPSVHARAVEKLFNSAEVRIRTAALETGLLLGLPAAQSARLRQARAHDDHALLLTALVGSEAEQELIFAALDDPGHRTAALRALGFIGTQRAAEFCLRFIDDPDKLAAGLAGEAFSMITGLNSGPFALAPEQDDESISDAKDGLGESAVLALPVLDPSAVAEWWKGKRPNFKPGPRYLRGEPRTLANIGEQLARLPMRWRNVILLELSLRKPGTRPFSPRSWTRRQEERTRTLLVPAS
jgi:uncharacterized protein (TIGR02270 family)